MSMFVRTETPAITVDGFVWLEYASKFAQPTEPQVDRLGNPIQGSDSPISQIVYWECELPMQTIPQDGTTFTVQDRLRVGAMDPSIGGWYGDVHRSITGTNPEASWVNSGSAWGQNRLPDRESAISATVLAYRALQQEETNESNS